MKEEPVVWQAWHAGDMDLPVDHFMRVTNDFSGVFLDENFSMLIGSLTLAEKS